MKITIMQPYFIPYPGYFRLFTTSDLFVVYDCVQFPRRSWVHRNQLLNEQQVQKWVTLPLQKQPMETLIKDLYFRENIQEEWNKNLEQFNTFKKLHERYPQLSKLIKDISANPVTYIVKILEEICCILNIPFNIAYSSTVNLPETLKGQDRIVALAKHFNATTYINSPGGRALYNEEFFNENNLQLRFLTPYQGSFLSIIQCLADMSLEEVKKSIAQQAEVVK